MPVDLSVHEGETKERYRARVIAESAAAKGERRAEVGRGEAPVVFDVDDYGFLLPGHDELLMLRKSFPDFKATCFTIPLPKEFYAKDNIKHFDWAKYRKWAEMVNSLGWLEVACHGFSHVHHECYTGYGKAVTTIVAAEKVFARVGLKYAKIWRAPYWQMSYDFIHALKDRGWTVALDRNSPQPVPEGTRTYTYNWSIQEPLPPSGPVLGHSHFRGDNANNILDCLGNVLKELPTEAKFMTVSEYLEKYGEEK